MFTIEKCFKVQIFSSTFDRMSKDSFSHFNVYYNPLVSMVMNISGHTNVKEKKKTEKKRRKEKRGEERKPRINFSKIIGLKTYFQNNRQGNLQPIKSTSFALHRILLTWHDHTQYVDRVSDKDTTPTCSQW